MNTLRIRSIAAALVLTLGAQSVSPLAMVAAADQTSSVQQEIQIVLSKRPGELSDLLRKYVDAYVTNNSMKRALFSTRVKKWVFARAGSPQYIDALRQIDELARLAPEPIYDLAKSLQLHWEANFAVGLGEKRSQRLTTGAKIGAVVGMAILGVSMIRKPQNAGRYFKIFKQLAPIAPLAGASAGVGSAYAVNASGVLEGNVPVAPAHVMSLGISTHDFHYDDREIINDIMSLTAASAAAEVAYYAIKGISLANKAATPAKINPVALVVSLVVFFAIEKGVKYALDEREYARFETKYLRSRDIIEWGLAATDDTRIYTGADALLKSASNLAQYLNKPLMQAIQEYADAMGEAAQKYGEGSARFNSELVKKTEELSKQVRDFQAEKRYTYDSDYETTLVLGFLMNHEENSIRDLGENAQVRADQIRRDFERWLAHNEQREGTSFGGPLRQQYFHEYLRRMSEANDRRIVEEFRASRVRRDATHVLLAAAAYLRETKREYVSEQADALMAIAQRNDLLMAVTKNRALIGNIDIPASQNPAKVHTVEIPTQPWSGKWIVGNKL